MMAIAIIIILLTFLHGINMDESSRPKPLANNQEAVVSNTSSNFSYLGRQKAKSQDRQFPPTRSFTTKFHGDSSKPLVSNYTQVMVVPSLRNDDVSWIDQELPGLNTAIYVVDEPTMTLHPPKNKGHEVMTYLTYIIDHYYELPDAVIFMHAHRWTHHNNELLNYDSAEMVRRLRNDYVAREGYINMRCQWHPGCPEWLHPANTLETLAKQEETVFSQSWHEMFPSEPIPSALGQGCCAQFALSKERILSIPLSRFIFYRDWVLRTPLSDYISGRVWEYLWQFHFTGRSIYCPSESTCYCEGFGVCFGSEAGYQEFKELRRQKEMREKRLKDLKEAETAENGERRRLNSSMVGLIDSECYSNLSGQVDKLEREIRIKMEAATNYRNGS